MILSVHLADVGVRAAAAALFRPLKPAEVLGLRCAEMAITAPLGGLLPGPQFGRLGLIAAWNDDSALERFVGAHPLAARLAGGWHVRLEPLRAVGSWSALPELAEQERAGDDEEPVAVITLGRLRLRRAIGFFRTNRPAADLAVADPSLLLSTGLARPPRLVATFSLWRTTAAMRAYSDGQNGPGHASAIKAHRKESFHHEAVFARFRPYAAQGVLDGREPLAAALSGQVTTR